MKKEKCKTHIIVKVFCLFVGRMEEGGCCIRRAWKLCGWKHSSCQALTQFKNIPQSERTCRGKIWRQTFQNIWNAILSRKRPGMGGEGQKGNPPPLKKGCAYIQAGIHPRRSCSLFKPSERRSSLEIKEVTWSNHWTRMLIWALPAGRDQLQKANFYHLFGRHHSSAYTRCLITKKM